MPLFIQDGVTVSEDCVSVRGITASYELSYATDSGVLNTICVIEGTECSNGVCHHELQNSTADSRCQPPVSQFSEDLTVSVTARNIVGRNNHAVSKRISEFSVLYLQVKSFCVLGGTLPRTKLLNS